MSIKRSPEAFPSQGTGGPSHRFEQLSKADWADVYADLYRQVFGEDATPDAILDDATNRDAILRRYRGDRARKYVAASSAEKRAAYLAHMEELRAVYAKRRAEGGRY